jgi:class 3 adenylate cyclase
VDGGPCSSCGFRRSAGDIACPRCGAQGHDWKDPSRSRKIVTAMFVDLVGSTRLAEQVDPELLSEVLDRYFMMTHGQIAAYGGQIEKFIGDAVLAVYGIPVAAPDDAVRAARAAAGIIDGCTELNQELTRYYGVELEVRIGISTGEAAVSVFGNGSFRVVGDVVNVASRLQSAAAPGTVLLTEETARYLRRRADLEPVPPVAAKGKSQPVRAWRLRGILAESASPVSSFVGREAELDLLRQLHHTAVQASRVQAVNVVGQTGVGKSRLVREFAGRTAGSTALTGSCRTGGPGTTYEPIRQMLADGVVLDHSRAGRVVEESILGGASVAGVEEIAWSVREFFCGLSQAAPLILVFDDFQLADPTLVSLAASLAASPGRITLACITLPGIESGLADAYRLDVPPLPEADAAALITQVLGQPGAEADTVLAASEGNPQFIELMCAVLATGQSPDLVSAGVATLLDAHLALLTDDDLDLLFRSATAGRSFTGADLTATGCATARLDPGLTRLGQYRLIEAEGNGRFRFTHGLVRDAAYARAPKALRARWHQLIAQSHEEHDPQSAAHWEAAYNLGRAVRPADPGILELGRSAATALTGLGTIALRRRDLPAAVAMLERARACTAPADPAYDTLSVLMSDAWLGTGSASESLGVLPEPGGPAARIQRALASVRTGRLTPEAAWDAVGELRQAAGDPFADGRCSQLEAFLYVTSEELDEAEQALLRAAALARESGHDYEHDRISTGLCELALWGSTPVPAGLDRCASVLQRLARDRALVIPVRMSQAGLLALDARSDEACVVLDEVCQDAAELRVDLALAVLAQVEGLVHTQRGDHGNAERAYADGRTALLRHGQHRAAQTLTVHQARSVLAQGRSRDAAAMLAGLQPEDLRTRMLSTGLEARLALAEGNTRRALTAACAAIRMSGHTADLVLQGDVLWDCAAAFRAAGRGSWVAERARDCYRRKGATAPLRRLTDWMEDFRA